MKKYLMTVMAAVALGGLFVGCSKDADLNGGENSVEFNIVQNYEKAFVTRFGEPAETQTWGFGENVATTRTAYTNGNMWADQGYLVPPQLTEEQKDIVRQYFQQNTPIGYQDPGWENFFIQHVYKGATNTSDSKSTEKYISANGGVVTGSNHMDHLAAVFSDGTKDHINNYNNAICSTYGNVKDSEGVTYRDSQNGYHPDEIQLMLNSTTHSFGYFNSDGSLGHTEYTGLVGWETIRTWANSKGLNGDCLNDGWNRSFMGFDFEQVVGDDVYAKNGSGNITYAKYNEAPESPQYIWDGENVIPINNSTKTVTSKTDLMSRFSYTWNDNETITDNADGTKTYVAVKWGGMAAWIDGEDWSSYDRLVFELASQAPAKSNTVVQYINSAGEDASYEFKAGAWASTISCDFSGKDVTRIKQTAFQMDDEREQNWNNYTFIFSKIYLEGSSTVDVPGIGEYMYYNNKQVPYLSSDQNTYCGDFQEYGSDDDVKIRKQYNGTEVVCLNWKKLVDERLSQGYLPVAGSNMKKWVKVQGGADGYYSDWIVTLTKANNGTTPPPPVVPPTGFVCRIVAEDLTVGENSDFDFNDVVFDVINGGTTLRLRAAGGELPLSVAGQEVHDAFATKYSGITRTTLINTGWNGTVDYENYYVDIPSGGTYSTRALAETIPIVVTKNGQQITLKAEKAKVASKIAVGSDFEWCSEREDIDRKFRKNDGTKLFQQYVRGISPYNNDDWISGSKTWYQFRGE